MSSHPGSDAVQPSNINTIEQETSTINARVLPLDSTLEKSRALLKILSKDFRQFTQAVACLSVFIDTFLRELLSYPLHTPLSVKKCLNDLLRSYQNMLHNPICYHSPWASDAAFLEHHDHVLAFVKERRQTCIRIQSLNPLLTSRPTRTLSQVDAIKAIPEISSIVDSSLLGDLYSRIDYLAKYVIHLSNDHLLT